MLRQTASVALLAVAMPAFGAVLLDGTEFAVNSWTSGGQLPHFQRSIDANQAGEVVSVWQSGSVATADIVAQRLQADGGSLGSSFVVHEQTTGLQLRPSVAVNASGFFLIVWSDWSGRDGDDLGVFGRAFTSGGQPMGSEFRINTYTPGQQSEPHVAVLPDDNFVVVWQGAGPANRDSAGIFGRRIAPDGRFLDQEFLVNTHTPGEQMMPFVATSIDAGMIVVWESAAQSSGEIGVYGRQFDGFGAPIGDEFPIAAQADGVQRWPTIADDERGGFFVVWTESDGDGEGIAVRHFDADGQAVGAPFQVNSSTTGAQYRPSVVRASSGDYLVVWTSRARQDGDGAAVVGRRISRNGASLGPEFVINTYTVAFQGSPTIERVGTGRFLATWASDFQDGDAVGVFAQFLCESSNEAANCLGSVRCPGSTDLTDSDSDMIPDPCDPCTVFEPSQLMIGKTTLVLDGIDTDRTDKKTRLKARAEFVLPSGKSIDDLDPIATGARVAILGHDGMSKVDVVLPEGPFERGSGWLTNRGRDRYAFKDRTKSPLNNGIVRFSITKNRGEQAGGIKVRIKGKGGSYPVAVQDSPVTLVLAIGDAAAGECGEVAFAPGECILKSDGQRVICR